MEDLQTERTALQKRETDVRSREEALRQQQEILAMLKADLQQVQSKIDETIVRTTQSEQANLKRLAERYGKMDPDSVATLLTKMETARAAAILLLLGDRQAGAVLAAAVATGSNGVRNAADWSDGIRRMASEQGPRK
jgi:flagellar motility protein MotE (MotC chaperone)